MEHSYIDFYHKLCEIVQLKEEAVKQLKMIYHQMPDKLEALKEPRESLPSKQHPPDAATTMQDGLEKWLCKWKVMDYLKISKTTYYRWRTEGKLVPRNGVGEDRYLWDDIKNIVKKRIE